MCIPLIVYKVVTGPFDGSSHDTVTDYFMLRERYKLSSQAQGDQFQTDDLPMHKNPLYCPQIKVVLL